MTAHNRETSAPWWRTWRTARWGDWVGLVARLVLGGVLLVAGAIKIPNLQDNVLAVKAYQLVSPQAAQIIGYLQPPLEILLGLALILGLFTRVMGALGAITMVIFIFGISWAWAKGLSLDCGCFGGGGEIAPEDTRYGSEILRDVGLMLLGLWLAIRPKSAWSLDGWLRGSGAELDHLDEDDEASARPAASSKKSSAKSAKTRPNKTVRSTASAKAIASKSGGAKSGSARTGNATATKTRTSAPVKTKVGAQKRSGSSRSRKR